MLNVKWRVFLGCWLVGLCVLCTCTRYMYVEQEVFLMCVCIKPVIHGYGYGQSPRPSCQFDDMREGGEMGVF